MIKNILILLLTAYASYMTGKAIFEAGFDAGAKAGYTQGAQRGFEKGKQESCMQRRT